MIPFVHNLDRSGTVGLKTADALQLSAALLWCENEPDGRAFVCSNGVLRTAANDEGFQVLPPEET
jgi:hypothetical protein